MSISIENIFEIFRYIFIGWASVIILFILAVIGIVIIQESCSLILSLLTKSFTKLRQILKI